MFAMLYYVLIGWALLEVGLLSWKRPERLNASWSWTWPAPARGAVLVGPSPLPYGPAAGPGAGRWRGAAAVQYLTVDPVHVGATADWSPKHAAAEAEAGMLPLDDVDEWLAARLSEYGSALVDIDARPRVTLLRGDAFRTLDEELARFVDGSQALHAYRALRIGDTGSYTMREAAQVEALLLV